MKNTPMSNENGNGREFRDRVVNWFEWGLRIFLLAAVTWVGQIGQDIVKQAEISTQEIIKLQVQGEARDRLSIENQSTNRELRAAINQMNVELARISQVLQEFSRRLDRVEERERRP